LSYETLWNNNDWTKEENIFHITYKDLKEKNVRKINLLQTYLFGSIKFDSSKSIDCALEKPSLTKR
jgi:hypothetical protein